MLTQPQGKGPSFIFCLSYSNWKTCIILCFNRRQAACYSILKYLHFVYYYPWFLFPIFRPLVLLAIYFKTNFNRTRAKTRYKKTYNAIVNTFNDFNPPPRVDKVHPLLLGQILEPPLLSTCHIKDNRYADFKKRMIYLIFYKTFTQFQPYVSLFTPSLYTMLMKQNNGFARRDNIA